MLKKTRRRGTLRRARGLNRAVHFLIEPLEQRLVFSVFTVTSLADAGAGTLRAAIADANAASGSPNTIVFASGLNGEIDLTSGVLEASAGNITIQGPGPRVLTVDGGDEQAIFQVGSGATANISGLTMSDGMALAGGAITNVGTLTVDNCDLSNNTASIAAGAIFNSGTLTLTNSTLGSNSAPGAGGVSNDGPLNIEGCTFTGNLSTTDGGAIATNSAAVSIVNSTFDGNVANQDGGAISAGSGSTLTVVNSTIVANVAQTGGGIDIISGATDVTIYNTIVASNETDDRAPNDISGTLDAGLNFEQSPSSNNLIGTGGSGGLTNGSDGNLVGVTNLGLGTLAINGGPTETIPLVFPSPAIAAGNPAFAIDSSGHPLLTDQRGVGFPRQTDGELNIGAFQLQGTAPSVIFVDKSATGANNGDDWEDAFTSLDSALQRVASGGTGSTTVNIDVAAGTYVPGASSFNIPAFGGNLIIQGGFAHGGSATPDPIANVTTLSGGSSNVLLDNALDLTLNGLTISGGKATGGSAPQNEGGGVNVLATSGMLTVVNCNFTDNTAATFGGAIYSASAAVSLSVSDSTFTGNFATSSAGGAVFTLADSSTFTSCTFSQNNSSFAGALDAQSATTGSLSVLTLNGDTFSNNTAGDSAAAILSGFGNVIVATDCTFTSNSAPFQGGAVSIFHSAGNYQSGQGFVNCLFAQNTCTGTTSVDASAISVDQASPFIINCTFTANVANGEPAVADTSSSVTTIANSILYGDGSSEITNDGTSSASISFSDVQGSFSGTGNINSDPLFVSPPTNLQLQGDSPCVNTGLNSAVPSGVTTDLAGNPRIFGSAVDMGAFEIESSPLQITSVNGADFTLGTAGSFTVTTTGNPTPDLSETNLLPQGVTFVNNNNGTATISGTPDGVAGNYFLTLTAANGASPDATQTFTLTVDQAPQAPAITSAAQTIIAQGSPATFTITATGFPQPQLSITGSLPAGVTFMDNGNGTATLAGATDASTGKYPITITATNTQSNASQDFTLKVHAPSKPTITSNSTVTLAAGSANTFTITTSGAPVAALTETGTLPSGLTFTDNGDGTATLAGRPALGSGGKSTIQIVAKNGLKPNGKQSLKLVVLEAPAIVSADTADFTVGSASTFMVNTVGFPAPLISEKGNLPAGIFFQQTGAGTGMLFGTPLRPQAGEYTLTFVAKNTSGPKATQTFTLDVTRTPKIKSADSATFVAGTASTFTITAAGFPLPAITETGTLPAGLSLTDNQNGTATIAGTPAADAGGMYDITIVAKDGVKPNAKQPFTIDVEEATAFTSAAQATFAIGVPDSFTIATTGSPAAALTKRGKLPSGVTFIDNGNGTATLSGTPADSSSGQYQFEVTANNGASVVQDFDLNVQAPPSVVVGESNGSIQEVLPDGTPVLQFIPFPGVTTTPRVALAQGAGDATPDIIAGSPPGSPPIVKIFDGSTASLIGSFEPFASSFTGGVYVAAGNVNDDGTPDIIVGAGSGGGPEVEVFDGKTLALIASFFAYSTSYTGGVAVASADFNHDGHADIVTATAGSGQPPLVEVFDGASILSGKMTLLGSATPFASGFTGGALVSTGDVNDDGTPDIIVTPVSAPPIVTVLDGNTFKTLQSFVPFTSTSPTSLVVSSEDVNYDGFSDIIAFNGKKVSIFSGKDNSLLASFLLAGGN